MLLVQKRIRRLLDQWTINKTLAFALRDEGIKNFIIELNQEQLFEEGETSTGQSLGPYSQFTVKLKKLKGQRVDHVTLKDTGEFYKTFDVIVALDGSFFQIVADGDKDDKNLFDV